MQYKITPPAVIDTTVALPASKSISNRALIIHALTGGDIMPDNLSDCDDTEVIVRAFKEKPEVVDLQGAGTAPCARWVLKSAIPTTRAFRPFASPVSHWRADAWKCRAT